MAPASDINYARGIKSPPKRDLEKYDRVIREYTNRFCGLDFDFKDSPGMLSKVLHCANGLLNYIDQSQMGRESIGSPDAGDSKCTPWQSVFRLTSSR
jgi:hypothetical protein